jgi:putative membrane protein
MSIDELKKRMAPLTVFCRKYAIAILASLYLVAILCVNSIPMDLLVRLAPVLYLLGLVFNLVTHNGNKKKLLILLGFIYGIGTVYEILSLNYISFTGVHSFGSILGIKLLGVPIVMGFNWFLLVMGAGYFSRWIFDSILMRIVSASFFMILAYFIMDPVSHSLGLWQWRDFHLTLGNYGSRLILTLGMNIFFAVYMKGEENRFAPYYYLLTTLLFITLNIVL